MNQPQPRLAQSPPGAPLEQFIGLYNSTVNALQNWFAKTSPALIDDTFTPTVTRQTVGAGFTIQPTTYNIELFAAGAVVSSVTNAIQDGVNGAIILIQNISAFNITIKNGATTKLNGAVDYVMTPSSTLMLRWDGTDWVECARSVN